MQFGIMKYVFKYTATCASFKHFNYVSVSRQTCQYFVVKKSICDTFSELKDDMKLWYNYKLVGDTGGL